MERLRLSSFSVILIMVVLACIGAFLIPLLSVQYAPQSSQNNINIGYSYGGASARVAEAEVTSKLEGALSTIDGVDEVRAYSWQGGGQVGLTFKESKAIDMARFEVATQIRQLYNSLPEGVSYPNISLAASGGRENHIMSYRINGDMPSEGIAQYAQERLIPSLVKVEGIESVTLSGATPYHYVITYDPTILRAAQLTASDINSAINSAYRNDIVGIAQQGELSTSISLRGSPPKDMLDIVIKSMEGRIYYLRDFATVEHTQMLPSGYSRVNGLNTIDLRIVAGADVNVLTVSQAVKEKMEELKVTTPENISYSISYDSSEAIEKEISTIVLRSVLSLAILLLFVLLVSRNFRYLLIIFTTIAANLFVAVIFYYFGGVTIELYSMAGITVSLGIIIDTAIVMVDHYTYYHNKRVLGSIFGALLTTIASLSIIFFLPDKTGEQLIDFTWVIIINLSVSMIIAALFVPALLDKLPLRARGGVRHSHRRKRTVVKFTMRYERYINWARRRKAIFATLLILGFGLPIHMLPQKLESERQGIEDMMTTPELNTWQKIYNSTIGSEWYTKHRAKFEVVLGGAFRLFTQNLNTDNYYRQPTPRKELSVNASMPEGTTVHQLNEVMQAMENFLSQYSQIDSYRTHIYGNSGSIRVNFTAEAENSSFPHQLKSEIITKAASYGGAVWAVYGINENNFNNNIFSSFKSNAIELKGYNYDMLYKFAQQVVDSLSGNKRVKDIEISDRRDGSPRSEYFLEYDKAKIAHSGLDVNRYFSFLTLQLYDQSVGRFIIEGEPTNVQLTSSQKDAFDLWHIENDMVDIDSTKTRLKDVGTIEKRATGNNINRHNQQYTLVVGYNFVGSPAMSKRMQERLIKTLNEEVLPIGYNAEQQGYGYWSQEEQKQQIFLLLLIIVIIYALCAIIFESLTTPLLIILMIPVGLIGLFLTFGVGGFTFDQGGFAAAVMLCGIVVNAGIYLLSEYRTVRAASHKTPLRGYLSAYNRKIIPTLLTIISTVLGLVPFLFDGTDEVFWFAFAVGVMGGMLFSIVAIVFILPVFIKFRAKSPLRANHRP